MEEKQAASAVILVRPKHFGFNAQTFETNHFQVKKIEDVLDIVDTFL